MAPAAHGEILARQIPVLSALLRTLGLPASLLSPLLAHAEAVRRDADRLGLVSPTDTAHVVVRHTADSLLFALVRRPMPLQRWVDVGTGAGFPGLVLACCFPQTTFALIEPQRRRAGFLELQCARLGIANAEVVAARAESLSPIYDVACARALADPEDALKTLKGLVTSGGVAVVAVGRQVRRPPSVEETTTEFPGVDSPGRFFIAGTPAGGG